MRVNELKEAIENVRAVLAAGGAGTAERDLARLIDLLAAQGDKDLDTYISEVKAVLDPKGPDVGLFIARLKSAGDDEKVFKSTLDEIAKAPAIKKPEALKIAQGYGVIRLNERSKASIVESIEKHFYWSLYQRDADAMAKRATPW